MTPLPAISTCSQDLLSTATAPALSRVKEKLQCVRSPFSPQHPWFLLEGVFIVAFPLPIVVSVADVGTHVRNRFGLAFIIGVAGEGVLFTVPDSCGAQAARVVASGWMPLGDCRGRVVSHCVTDG